MSGTSRRRHRRWIPPALLIATVLITGWLGRADRSVAGPEGTLALQRMLRAMGTDVRESGALPAPPATVVLLADLRSAEQTEPLAQWVGQGGRLVVADPRSTLLAGFGVGQGELPSGLPGIRTLAPGCVAPEAAGITRIAVAVSEVSLAARDQGSVACYGEPGSAFLVTVARGRGRLVALGGRSPLTNRLLRREDNAVFALRALGSAGPVLFAPALPEGVTGRRCGDPWSCLPDPARRVLAQVAVAVLAFALMRGRRLGAPLEETPTSPIPAGELVRAAGRLYRAAGARDHAAEIMRSAARHRWSRRLGIGAGENVLPALVARAGDDHEEAEARQALAGPPPANDDELIELAVTIERIERRLEGGTL